jgi:hypothetical protein
MISFKGTTVDFILLTNEEEDNDGPYGMTVDRMMVVTDDCCCC